MGARLAQRLRCRFVDSDAQLRNREHRSAVEIADQQGRAALHAGEASVLLDALDGTEPAVIAAAASVVDDLAVVTRLGDNDVTTVWLRATPETLRRRASSGAHRPFVDKDPAAAERLDGERRPRYEAAADVVVDVDDRSREQIVAVINAALTR